MSFSKIFLYNNIIVVYHWFCSNLSLLTAGSKKVPISGRTNLQNLATPSVEFFLSLGEDVMLSKTIRSCMQYDISTASCAMKLKKCLHKSFFFFCRQTAYTFVSSQQLPVGAAFMEKYFRIGWAYALACVTSMLSICCPILARLVADRHKRYKMLSTEAYIWPHYIWLPLAYIRLHF